MSSRRQLSGSAVAVDVERRLAVLVAMQPGIRRKAGQRAGDVEIVAIFVGARAHHRIVIGDGVGLAHRDVVAEARPAGQLVGRAGPGRPACPAVRRDASVRRRPRPSPGPPRAAAATDRQGSPRHCWSMSAPPAGRRSRGGSARSRHAPGRCRSRHRDGRRRSGSSRSAPMISAALTTRRMASCIALPWSPASMRAGVDRGSSMARSLMASPVRVPCG